MPSPFLSTGLQKRDGSMTDVCVVPNWSTSETVRWVNGVRSVRVALEVVDAVDRARWSGSTHIPAWQTSFCVHALPSSQGWPSRGSASWSHLSAPSLHESIVQGFESSQLICPPVQAPALQASPVVQKRPSSHVGVSLVCVHRGAVAGVVGARLWSSQSVAVPPLQLPSVHIVPSVQAIAVVARECRRQVRVRAGPVAVALVVVQTLPSSVHGVSERGRGSCRPPRCRRRRTRRRRCTGRRRGRCSVPPLQVSAPLQKRPSLHGGGVVGMDAGAAAVADVVGADVAVVGARRAGRRRGSCRPPRCRCRRTPRRRRTGRRRGVQVPPLQVSVPLQKRPSSHGAVLFGWTQARAVAGVVGADVAVVGAGACRPGREQLSAASLQTSVHSAPPAQGSPAWACRRRRCRCRRRCRRGRRRRDSSWGCRRTRPRDAGVRRAVVAVVADLRRADAGAGDRIAGVVLGAGVAVVARRAVAVGVRAVDVTVAVVVDAVGAVLLAHVDGDRAERLRAGVPRGEGEDVLADLPDGRRPRERRADRVAARRQRRDHGRARGSPRDVQGDRVARVRVGRVHREADGGPGTRPIWSSRRAAATWSKTGAVLGSVQRGTSWMRKSRAVFVPRGGLLEHHLGRVEGVEARRCCSRRRAVAASGCSPVGRWSSPRCIRRSSRSIERVVETVVRAPGADRAGCVKAASAGGRHAEGDGVELVVRLPAPEGAEPVAAGRGRSAGGRSPASCCRSPRRPSSATT